MTSDEHTHGLAAGNGRPVLSAVSDVDGRQIGGHGPADWRGITLVHRGGELGVVGHVSRGGDSFERVLHAFGGISRSLEYAVPESAIVAVLGVSARALVDDVLNFEPQHLCGDGRVILAPHPQRRGGRGDDEAWRSMPTAAWTGIRVYADDGYLGEVKATVPSSRSPLAEAVIVRARVRFWKNRFPVIPLSRIVACTPCERVARVAGTRQELSSMSERVPAAR